MNKKGLVLVLLSLLALSIQIAQAQTKKSAKDLDRKYRKWLEEEVVYIITPKEKQVFLQLETDREREIFINSFWKQRDPDPITPENEFTKEHYRRLNYANQWFGKDSPGEGWRTDMGRIYIILGEPNSIDRYENLSEVYPLIIWFYGGKMEYGLPNAFNVVFFKKAGIGEYELYSSVKYGPQSLLIHYKGDTADYMSAYNQLLNIEPVIAEVSLSLIPGESQFNMSPSIASEILVTSKIPLAPQQKVKDTYAEKLLKYKDFIEVDYTANYIENESDVKIIRGQNGVDFVHFLIEPKRLTIEALGNKFRTYLEVNCKIADLKGITIYQYDRSIPIEFNQEQMANIKAKLFSFQDMFPIIEGNYKLNVLLKNTISKEFTSIEKDISVPPRSSFQISSLLLANRIVENSEYRGKNKPFLVGDIQLVPSPRNDFSSQDQLYLYFQVLGLTEELKEAGFLEYSILKEGEKVYSRTKGIKEYPDPTNFFEEFSLSNLPPAYYKVRVSLFNKNKQELLFEQSEFFISHIPQLPRPWVLSVPMPGSEDPLYANILGNQFSSKNEREKARSFLEEAYRKEPFSAKFALDFCSLLFINKEYQKVKKIALPFLRDQQRYEFLAILGQSSQALGQMEEAIVYYKDYLYHFGTHLQILNSIGECYYRLGNREEALIAWEKSLEINPNQENIKKIVNSLKGKK